MKKLSLLIMVVWMTGWAGFAQAYSLTFNPVSQNILLGGTAQVSLDLSLGLTETLFGFDIDLSYDPLILSFSSASLGAEASTWFLPFADLISPGLVNIAAFDDTSTGITNGTFTLATFAFLGQNLGTSLLTAADGPGGGLLIDIGQGFSLGIASAQGNVNVVPEPGTAILFGLGLIGLAGARRKNDNA